MTLVLEALSEPVPAKRIAAADRLLTIDPATFRRDFNRRPFLIGHDLAGHPLFEMARLVELARKLPDRFVNYSSGQVAVDAGLYGGPGNGLSIDDTLDRIDERCSWMVLKFVETDPEYRALLDRCLDEIREHSEPIAPGMWKREGFVFVSSPGSVTPFHVDPEYNFLLQVRGSKRVFIVDPDDRSVMPDEALERYYTGQYTRPTGEMRLEYKEEFRERARVFELSPGVGLHFPVTAPHWVEVGDEVSVSFSVTFENRECDRRRLIYAINSRLRGLGLNPSPCGRHRAVDAFKVGGFKLLSSSKRLLRRG